VEETVYKDEVMIDDYLIWLPAHLFWLWKVDDIFIYHNDNCGADFEFYIPSHYEYTVFYAPFKVGYRTLSLL